MASQTRKSKVKWTVPMNNALLECKRKAKELVSSERPPCKENGRRKGYMVVMKELWDDMGYAHLNLTSGNLRWWRGETYWRWRGLKESHRKMCSQGSKTRFS